MPLDPSYRHHSLSCTNYRHDQVIDLSFSPSLCIHYPVPIHSQSNSIDFHRLLLAGVPRDCHHEEAGPPQRCQTGGGAGRQRRGQTLSR